MIFAIVGIISVVCIILGLTIGGWSTSYTNSSMTGEARINHMYQALQNLSEPLCRNECIWWKKLLGNFLSILTMIISIPLSFFVVCAEELIILFIIAISYLIFF